MAIYNRKYNYRKIYESHYGKIPIGCDIHHIDGNPHNDNIENLQCVTIQEHFDIHFQKGDWASCNLISLRMNISPEERSSISKSIQKIRLENGTHNFITNNPVHKLIKEGNHPFTQMTSCPYCGKSGQKTIMYRWHFDKCKSKH